MCTNNNFNIECTDRLLQRFYKIKEKRKWEVICDVWIKYKRYGHHEYKFFHKIQSDSKLCAPSYNKSKWLSMICEKRFGNINSGGRQRPAGPFHFFETLQGPRKLGPGGPCRYLPRIKIASSKVILPYI